MSIPDFQVEVEDIILHLKDRLLEAHMEAVVLHSALDKAQRRIAELEAKCQQAPRKGRAKSAPSRTATQTDAG